MTSEGEIINGYTLLIKYNYTQGGTPFRSVINLPYYIICKISDIGYMKYS